MKSETENLFIELSNTISFGNLDNELREKMLGIISSIFMSEIAPTFSKGKLNYFKYTSKDKDREVITAALYEEGHVIATDTHILICHKNDYSEDLEGKLLLKDGKFLEGYKYPNYKAVIPNICNYKKVKIDFEAFDELCRKWKSDKKLKNDSYLTNTEGFFTLIFDDTTSYNFDMERFKLLCEYMQYIKTNEIYYTIDYQPIVVNYDESSAILMPCKGTETQYPTMRAI